MIIYLFLFTSLCLYGPCKTLSPIKKIGLYLYNFLETRLFTRVLKLPTFNYSLFGFFILIVCRDLLGLNANSQHLLLSRTSLTILIVVLTLWIRTYKPFFNSGGLKSLTTLLMVNIIIPSLSLLISIIEIITHLFRPITMLARIWVNLWVGHLLIGVVSYINCVVIRCFSYKSFLTIPILALTFLQVIFLYEVGVSLLQPIVLTYLSGLYFKENSENSK